MKHLFYILLAALALLLAAIAGAYLYLTTQEESQLRTRLETALEAALERDVRLAGRLTVELAPLPTVILREASVGNPEWASTPTMLSVGELRLQPSLWSLMTGDILLRHVYMQDARLWLENDGQGRASWRLDRTREVTSETKVQVGSAEAANLTVSYLDAEDGVLRETTLERARIGASSSSQPLQIELQGTLLELPWSLDGRIGSFDQLSQGQPFDFDIESRLGTSELAVDGTLEDPDLRDWDGLSLRFQVRGERPYAVLAWTDLPLPETEHMQLSGRLTGRRGRLALDQLSAVFGTNDYRVRLDGAIGHVPTLAEIRLEFEAEGRSPADIVPWVDPFWLATDSFSATGLLTGSQPDLAFESIDLRGRVDKTDVRMEGRTSDLMGTGELDLQLEVRGENLASVSRLSRVPIPDVDVLELRGRLTGNWQETRLTDITATLHEGTVTADVTGGIDDLTDLDGIDLAFDLTGENLDDIRAIVGAPGLIETDSVAARLRLSGNRHALTLAIAAARLQRGALVLEGDGRILDLLDRPRLDLRPELSGANVRDLGEIVGAGLPATDQFQVTGRLIGDAGHPDLTDMDARARLGNILIQMEGELPDVLHSRRFEARGFVRGDDLSLLGAQFGRSWPETRSFRFSGRASGTWQQPVLTGIEGTIVEERVESQVTGRVGDVLNGRDIDLAIQASAPSLNPLVAGDSAVLERLGKVTADFQLIGGPNHFDLYVRELRAGSSLLTGEFDLVVSEQRITRLQGNAVASRLDLSPWLLRDEGQPGDGPELNRMPPARVFDDSPLPVEWLEGLDVTLDLSDVTVTIGGGAAVISSGLLDIDDGVMKIGPLDLVYEQADVRTMMTVESRPVPTFTARVESKGFDIGSLVRRASGSSDARGLVDVELDLEARGRSMREMAAAANGRWAMLMTEGFLGEVFVNLRFTQMLGNLLPWARRETGVTINCGILDMPIDSGIARAHILLLDTPQMLMRGRGSVDLGQERYDLLLMPRPKRGRALAHHANVRVRGSFREPAFSIDASDTTTRVAGAVGRFALLGPAGLFVSRETFSNDREECAESLAQLGEIE